MKIYLIVDNLFIITSKQIQVNNIKKNEKNFFI